MSDVQISLANPYAGLQMATLEESLPYVGRALGLRMDSGDTAMFLRQLTYVYQQTYDVEYPELKARRFIPVDTRVPSGAETYVWHQFDKQGEADVGHPMGSTFPNVEVAGLEFGGKIVSLTASYQYTIQDLRAASMAGLPLETRKSEAVRRIMENKLEQIAWAGLPAISGDPLPIYGLTNFPNINVSNTTNVWTSSTVLQIVQDINALAKSIFDNTKGIHQPDTLLLPTAVYSYLATTPRSPTFTEDSMLQYILKVSPWLKTIDFSPFLDLAGKLQDGTTPGPRAVMYQKSPDILGLVIPQEFEQLPPQPVDMKFKIPCHMRTGGVNVYKPKAIGVMDGMTG